MSHDTPKVPRNCSKCAKSYLGDKFAFEYAALCPACSSKCARCGSPFLELSSTDMTNDADVVAFLSSYQLTCSYCNRNWHRRCLIPPMNDDELLQHMKAEGSRTWSCKRCSKRSSSHVPPQSSEQRATIRSNPITRPRSSEQSASCSSAPPPFIDLNQISAPNARHARKRSPMDALQILGEDDQKGRSSSTFSRKCKRAKIGPEHGHSHVADVMDDLDSLTLDSRTIPEFTSNSAFKSGREEQNADDNGLRVLQRTRQTLPTAVSSADALASHQLERGRMVSLPPIATIKGEGTPFTTAPEKASLQRRKFIAKELVRHTAAGRGKLRGLTNFFVDDWKQKPYMRRDKAALDGSMIRNAAIKPTSHTGPA